MDLMFRDESSHVIKKATAQARKGSVASSIKTTPSPTTPVSQPSRPTQLTWSPNETIPVSSRRGSLARKSPSSSTFSAESPSSLPSQFGFINQFELSPVALRSRKNSINNFKQEPKTPSFADFPAPIALSYSPSFEDRGLNLFIARYIEVVSALEKHLGSDELGLLMPFLLGNSSLRTPVKTNSTCESHHSAVLPQHTHK